MYASYLRLFPRRTPSMAVKPAFGTTKVRQVYNFWPVGPDVNFNVHNSNLENCKAAVWKRVMFVDAPGGQLTPPPQPLPGIFPIRCNEFKRRLLRHLPSTAMMSIQQFVDSYTGRKKTVYEKAAEIYKVRGVRLSDSYLSSFLKCEKINFTLKRDPDPRLIQPRGPVYNLAVGRYLKPLEHALYKAVAKVFEEVTITKGLNAEELGALCYEKWSKYRRPVAVGLDASRFDQHVSLAALMFEHSFYMRAYRDREFWEWLRWQRHNKGFINCADGSIKYNTVGTRCSGDMNTGMGACLLMCAMVWSYMRSIGVRKFSLLNNGDDCVLIFETRFLPRLNRLDRYFRDFGFNMKIEAPVYELEHIEFCQTHPVFDGTKYVMMRNFPVSIAKDLVSYKSVVSEAAWNGLRGSISDCGLALTGGLPVLPNFYTMLGRETGGKRIRDVERTGMSYMAERMARQGLSVTPDARASFFIAFGITPDEQLAMEEWFDNQTPKWQTPLPVDDFSFSPHLN